MTSGLIRRQVNHCNLTNNEEFDVILRGVTQILHQGQLWILVEYMASFCGEDRRCYIEVKVLSFTGEHG